MYWTLSAASDGATAGPPPHAEHNASATRAPAYFTNRVACIRHSFLSRHDREADKTARRLRSKWLVPVTWCEYCPRSNEGLPLGGTTRYRDYRGTAEPKPSANPLRKRETASARSSLSTRNAAPQDQFVTGSDAFEAVPAQMWRERVGIESLKHRWPRTTGSGRSGRHVLYVDSHSSSASAIAASGVSAAPSAFSRASSSGASPLHRKTMRRSCVAVSVNSRSYPCRPNAAAAYPSSVAARPQSPSRATASARCSIAIATWT